MSKSLKVLFYPIDAVGHVNAGIGIAEVLLQRGHRPVFLITEGWRGKLIKYGFEEEVLPEPEGQQKLSETDAAQFWVNAMKENNCFTGLTPLERTINVRKNLTIFEMTKLKQLDPLLENIFKKLKPDIILTDWFFTLPAIINSGIPWVFWCSPNPLVFLDDENTPPGCSGLPTTGPKSDWQEFRDAVDEVSYENWKDWNDFCVSKGVEPLPKNKFLSFSPYLNIYGFPLELDYLDLRPLPQKWYRFDNLKRTDKHSDFQIPDQLRGKPGKLVYFSLGSMGGADVDLMKRLINILSKSKHRFIVSKGPLHNKYELADNMWGEKSVPQIQVLSAVDLVITHGGNNTVTETFFFGKPMIVMPLFGDQYDNGQRIKEKGLGLTFNPHKCSEEELLEGIESLLNDKQLNQKLKNISKRIQTENSIEKLPKLLEELVIAKDNSRLNP